MVFKKYLEQMNEENTTNQNVWDRVKGDSLDKIHTLLYLHKRTIKNICWEAKKIIITNKVFCSIMIHPSFLKNHNFSTFYICKNTAKKWFISWTRFSFWFSFLWAFLPSRLGFLIFVFVSRCPILARILLDQFSQDLSSSISDHPLYLVGFLILLNPSGDFWSPWPAFSKNSVRLIYPEFPFTLYVSSSNFTSADLHTCILAQLPIAHAAWTMYPISVVPTTTSCDGP